MAESTTILNAQIGFLDTRLALIHLSLEAYPHFIQPILQLLLHNPHHAKNGDILGPSRPWAFWHPFVNVSITPNECSIVCPREQANLLFLPLVSHLDSELQKGVSISDEDFSAIVIGGEGLEAGQRVLDLTSPLALAGISIFFITSYWSDFILVSMHSRNTVIRALEDRGFVFEVDDTPGETGHMTNPASPLLQSHTRDGSASSFDFSALPGTPPPSTISEMQQRTFKILSRHNIKAQVDESIDLVTCAGVKDYTLANFEAKFTAGKMNYGLIQCLTSLKLPRFLSLTLTATDSASLTMERELLQHFPANGEDILLGTDSPEQVPITFDLEGLPLASTGIVCGVSSRLIDGMKGRVGHDLFNMSYLSTARAGHVIVYTDELSDALKSLNDI